jgi:hypothetical protein
MTARPTPAAAAHRLIRKPRSHAQLAILDVTEAQYEPDLKPDRLLNNLGREAVAAIADLVITDGYGICGGGDRDPSELPHPRLSRPCQRLRQN